MEINNRWSNFSSIISIIRWVLNKCNLQTKLYYNNDFEGLFFCYCIKRTNCYVCVKYNKNNRTGFSDKSIRNSTLVKSWINDAQRIIYDFINLAMCSCNTILKVTVDFEGSPISYIFCEKGQNWIPCIKD